VNAEFGDAHNAATQTEIIEQFGLRGNERDDALGKRRHLDGAVHLIGDLNHVLSTGSS
jgi:hypothetical protein